MYLAGELLAVMNIKVGISASKLSSVYCTTILTKKTRIINLFFAKPCLLAAPVSLKTVIVGKLSIRER